MLNLFNKISSNNLNLILIFNNIDMYIKILEEYANIYYFLQKF